MASCITATRCRSQPMGFARGAQAVLAGNAAASARIAISRCIPTQEPGA